MDQAGARALDRLSQRGLRIFVGQGNCSLCHFGPNFTHGEFHELGFMLLYFQPALYCNVSEAWLFPEKYKRVWVSFAGAYFELFLWAIATLVWRLTETDTSLNFFSLVVMATSGIKTLFNLNPLLKLDGYYLLSDYLEMPNLRKRSFRYVGAMIKRLLGSGRDRVQEATPRERRIYVLYGLAATAFSIWFLGFVILNLGGALMGQYQAIGLAAFGAAAGTCCRGCPGASASLRCCAAGDGSSWGERRRLVPECSVVAFGRRLVGVHRDDLDWRRGHPAVEQERPQEVLEDVEGVRAEAEDGVDDGDARAALRFALALCGLGLLDLVLFAGALTVGAVPSGDWRGRSGMASVFQ